MIFRAQILGPGPVFRAFFELSEKQSPEIWASRIKFERREERLFYSRVPLASHPWFFELKFWDQDQYLELFLSFPKNKVPKFELPGLNLSVA